MIRKLFLILIFSTYAYTFQAQVWTNLIDSVSSISDPDIYCAVEDSTTHTLYFGGAFTRINHLRTHGVIKFDGTNFDTLQSGTDDNFPGPIYSVVRNMTMYKNKLYIFGNFNRVGHHYSPNMAVWNGTTWDSIIAKGIPEFSCIYNGDMLVLGLDSIQGIDVNGVARFDGINWYDFPIPHTYGHSTEYMAFFQGKLYKTGMVTPSSSSANLSYSDGIDWIPWVGINGDAYKAVFGMKVIDSLLWVYGRFNSIAGTNCAGLAAFNGKQWYGFGQGISTAGGWERIESVNKFNGDLYITGLFDKIENISSSNFQLPQTTNIAKFDGEKWCIISPPIDNDILGLVQYKNDLYAYGAFNKIANDTIRGIGKFNGGYPSAICSSNIDFTMSTLGLAELLTTNNLKIYPNPTNGKFKLEFSNINPENISLELTNSVGAVIFRFVTLPINENINLSNVSAGIYFLKFFDGTGQKVFKVVKE